MVFGLLGARSHPSGFSGSGTPASSQFTQPATSRASRVPMSATSAWASGGKVAMWLATNRW